jgi:hypothetical protein
MCKQNNLSQGNVMKYLATQFKLEKKEAQQLSPVPAPVPIEAVEIQEAVAVEAADMFAELECSETTTETGLIDFMAQLDLCEECND